MSYTVNQVAKLAGVTLRTLRYYDKIRLLTPARTEGGYRIYSPEDMERLQQILFFRELDFPLVKILEILSNPAFDRRAALNMQAQYLEKRGQRYLKLSQLAKQTLIDIEGGKKMTREDLFKGFNYDKMLEEQKQYQDEVKERWGNTEAYKESMAKTAQYTKEDWERINKIQMQNMKDLCDLYDSQVPPEDPRVQAAVDRARRFICDNFYDCSIEAMSNLGQMYVADERFTAFYEKFAPGLAAYYNEAIQYYCSNHKE